MEEFVPFGSRAYWMAFVFLAVTRGADLLSTRVATPRMVLEGNAVARWLGWKWGVVANVFVVILLSWWFFGAIAIGTTSALVAARNFQSAWLMRIMGEVPYRDWILRFRRQTPPRLLLSCLAGEAGLFALLGGLIINVTHEGNWLVPFGVGVGMIFYATAVVVFTLLSVWRSWRRPRYDARSN